MINFPKMHVATSVINRILNAAEQLSMNRPVQLPSVLPTEVGPSVPEPEQQGKQLDLALSQPVGDMPPLEDNPDSLTSNAAEGVLAGPSSLKGIISS